MITQAPPPPAALGAPAPPLPSNPLHATKAFLGAKEVRLYGIGRPLSIGGVMADHVLLVSFDRESPMGPLHGRSAMVMPSNERGAILAWPPNEFCAVGTSDLDERLAAILAAVSGRHA